MPVRVGISWIWTAASLFLSLAAADLVVADETIRLKLPDSPLFRDPKAIMIACPKGMAAYDECKNLVRKKGCRDSKGREQFIRLRFQGCSGVKVEAVEMRDDKYHGATVTWHENGNRAGIGYDKNGKLDGQYVTFFEDGKPQSAFLFKNGIQNGRQTEWDKAGNITLDVEMANGKITKSYLEDK